MEPFLGASASRTHMHFAPVRTKEPGRAGSRPCRPGRGAGIARRAGHPQSRAAGQAAYSGMVPEHGPLFLRLDPQGRAVRPRANGTSVTGSCRGRGGCRGPQGELVRDIARHRIQEIAGPTRSDAAPYTGHAGYPDSTLPGVTSRHNHACQFAPASSRRRSPAVPPTPPGRRSCAQGRWSVARAPVTRWTDCDRGPQADAEERITSAHRPIEIREKRRRVLSSRPAWITLRSSRRRA